ncbi:hypothetical protein Tco_1345798 [Tanacetum coccineum]
MGTPTQVCVRSCPNISASAGRPFRCVKSKDCHAALVVVECDASRVMSTLVFVDPESFTQANGAQSPEVARNPLPEDPLRPLAGSILDGTDTRLHHPFWFHIFRKDRTYGLRAHLDVIEPPTSYTDQTGGRDVESAFRKRFRSSYESSPSVSSPDLPLRKRYRGTSELVEDSEEDDEEDEEIEESMDSDQYEEEEAILGASAAGSSSLECAFRTLGFETPPLPEWTSGLLPIYPSPVSSPMILLTVPSPVASPVMAETEGFLTELGAQVKMQEGLIYDQAI